MKKLFLLTLLFIILIFSGCLSGGHITRIESDVSEEYLDNKFGDAYDFGIEEVYKGDVKDLLEIYRKSIIDDKDLSEAEKEESIASLKKIEPQNYQYLSFNFTTRSPFLKSEIDFQFELYDEDGNDILETLYYLPYKKTVTYYNSGYGYATHSYESYVYIWLIKSKVPFTTQYFPEEETYIYLVMTFPNGQKRKYQVKPFKDDIK